MSQPPFLPGQPPYGTPYQDPYGSPYGSPYGGSPYQQPYAAPASRAMAFWALGLSIVGCSVFTLLASVGLAIAVLVKSKDGRNHGKGVAIAALVICTLWVVAVAAAITIGVIGVARENRDAPRDAAGNVTERAEVSVAKLRIGDCFDDAKLAGAGSDPADAGRVEAIPCQQAHSFEVFYLFGLVGDTYPGETQAADLAEEGCVRAFRDAVGVALRKSQLTFGYYYPDQLNWDLDSGHRVTCALQDPTGPTSGTLLQSKR